MPNINPPPDHEAGALPESGPWTSRPTPKTKARRKRLGAVPAREKTVVVDPPNTVPIAGSDLDADRAAGPAVGSPAGQGSHDPSTEWLRRVRQNSVARRTTTPPAKPITAQERAAQLRQWILDQPERDAKARADREAQDARAVADVEETAAAERGGILSTDPEITPHQRRYLRVQEYLDKVEAIDRTMRELDAERLRLIEGGRREALATEYAYPLPNTDTTTGAAGFDAGEDAFRFEKGDPEDGDAIPVTFSADSVADRSYTSMVATTLTISPRAAELLVHTAQPLLQYFEPTLRLLDDGRTSYRHAHAVVDSGWSVPDEYKAEYEAILLPFAETLTPPQFARKAKAVAATYQDDPIEERHTEALEQRMLTVTPSEDGMADLNLHMDAAGAYAIRNRVERITTAIFRKEDGRTRTQMRADVASELLLTGTTELPGTPTIDQLNLTETNPHGVAFHEVPDDTDGQSADQASIDPCTDLGTGVVGTGLGAGVIGKVAIHIPALTLFDHGQEQAYLENYGPISFETAQLFAGNAPGFTRILTDPDTGATLSVGTKQYKVPDSTRCWILYRDRTCRFPGCSVPAANCDLDHAVDWQFGGKTSVDNISALCRKHHILKHNTAWSYTMNDAGVLTWSSPSGREKVTEPAHRLPVKTSGGTVMPDIGLKEEQEHPQNLSETEAIAETNDFGNSAA